MTVLYEGVKQPRLSVAARHSRRARLSMALLLNATFLVLAYGLSHSLPKWTLAASWAWLAGTLLMAPLQRRMERRGRLLRMLVLGYAFDAAVAGLLAWTLGGSEWIAGVGLMTTLALSGLYVPQGAMRWVLLACLGSLGLLVLSPYLGPLAPPRGPFPVLAPGLMGQGVDVALAGVFMLMGLASHRYGGETLRREDELRQANQRLRTLNEALSDQQFSLLVGQQDLMLANERLRVKNEEVLKSQDVIRTLASALEARDHYTQGHSSRVSDAAVLLARELGLSRDEQDTVRMGCLLHDIGKIHVPDAVLRKPGGLTEEEFILMRKHPSIGEQICRPLIFARPFLSIIRHHHERWDGKGYPDGLKGEEISLHARIAAVADAWDAMTSDRPYRKALPSEEAFGRLLAGSGTQFDPELAGLFVRVMERRVDPAPPGNRNPTETHHEN